MDGGVLDQVFAVFAATLRGLSLLVGEAAHGDLLAIAVLVWLVIMARVALRPPRRRERVSYGGAPPPRTLPTRRVEVEPAPPATLARPAGHTPRCTCSGCIPPAALPAPSDRIEPGPCRHESIARVTAPDGRLWRYTCANWQCDTVWPPDTTWPAGTLFTEEDL